MGSFSRRKTPTLPAAPAPSGPDQYVGSDEAGHTAREMLYLGILKDAGLDLETTRTVGFAFACRTEESAEAAAAALSRSAFTVQVSDADGTLPFWVLSASSEALSLVPGLAQWSPLMRRVGSLDDVIYDGWTAMCPDVGSGVIAEFRVAY